MAPIMLSFSRMSISSLAKIIKGFAGLSIQQQHLRCLSATSSTNASTADKTSDTAAEKSSTSTDEKEAEEKIAPASESSTSEKKADNELETAFQKEAEHMMSQIKDLDDKYKRALAERENVRQRLQRQIDEAKLFGIQGFCKDLLEVADILAKATESVTAKEVETNQPLKGLYEGLKMTEDQLLKVFNRNGLVQLNPEIGAKFDPNFHEAMFEVPTKNIEPGHIAEVIKIGYSLHKRTLRPVIVGVAKTES